MFSPVIDAVKLHLVTSALKSFILEVICSRWCPSDSRLTKEEEEDRK